MSEVKGIIIIGAGGHAGVVLDALHYFKAPIIGVLDDFQRPKTIVHGTSVLGRIEFKRGWEEVMFHVAIGDNKVREQMVERMGLPKERYINVMHPSCCAPKNVRMGTGNFFGAFSNIGPDSYVGDHSIINSHASLDHDGHLGSYSHLCPGVVTGGHVTIGQHTTVGLGALIRDTVRIGHRCFIHMGCVVTKDVNSDDTMAL